MPFAADATVTNDPYRWEDPMRDATRELGALAGVLLMVAAGGVHWLITPAAHPTASAMRHAAVVGQVIGAAAMAWWCWHRAGRASALLTSGRP